MTIQINGTTGISGVDGSAATPALQGTDSNTGIHFPAADTVAIDTGGSERVRCDSSGRLLVGTSTARSNVVSRTPSAQFETATAAYTGLSIINNSTGGFDPSLFLGSSKGSSAGSNTAVASGDGLGSILFAGADGTNLIPGAEIRAFVDATPGANDMPGRLVFSTTADGASSPTERLRIAQNGAWGLAGANYGSSGQVLTSNGSGSAPTWQANSGAITSATAVNSTSGTSIDFTGIPSWAKRVTVMFNGVSTSGTSNHQVQIGSGSVDATGYVSTAAKCFNSAANVATSATGFIMTSGIGAADLFYGAMTLSLLGSNIWSATFATSMPVATVAAHFGGGTKTLSGTLDRVRITTVNGTDTFDAGSINILYEG